jgi:hypothetical protein
LVGFGFSGSFQVPSEQITMRLGMPASSSSRGRPGAGVH